MTKCYLLGAGASYGYSDDLSNSLRPPTSREIFKKGAMFGLLSREKFPNLYRYVQDYLDTDVDLEDLPLYQLEFEVESFFQNIAATFSRSFSSRMDQLNTDRDAQTALGEAFYFIYELFRQYAKLYTPKNDNYRKLALHHYEQNYDVISLNYDILFEMAADSVGIPPNYGLSPHYAPTSISISKVHGSINWINRIDGLFGGVGSDISGITPHIFSNVFDTGNIIQLSSGVVESTPYSDFVRLHSAADEIALLPPFANYKSYDKMEEYDHIWDNAAQALSNATELVVIGCSLRGEDSKLVNLLDRTLSENIDVTVVAGSQSSDVEDKIEIMQPTATFDSSYDYFGEYADTL